MPAKHAAKADYLGLRRKIKRGLRKRECLVLIFLKLMIALRVAGRLRGSWE